MYLTEIVTTDDAVITDLCHLPSCDPLHVPLFSVSHSQFYTGKSSKGPKVFLKLYVDPSYNRESLLSVDSDNSSEYVGATTGTVLSNIRNEVTIIHGLYHDHMCSTTGR